MMQVIPEPESAEGADLHLRLTRLIGLRLCHDLGGLAGTIGNALAATAPPDGYTLTLTTSAINMNAALGQKLPFDVGNDFAPVAAVAYAPSVVVVNVGLAAKTVQELTALARARPGKLSYASAGIGSPAHLATELYKSTMGLDIAHIPYKGAPQAITDLIAGHVDILFANEMEITALYKANSFEEAADQVRGRCRVAALTRSEQGSLILNGDGTHRVEPFKLGPLVDTTGAGDLYAAGFLHAYCQGRALVDCGRLGSLCAGQVVTQLGPRPQADLRKLAAQLQSSATQAP